MEHLNLNINPNHLQETFKDSVFWSVIAYAKMYELLHMQLWRKGRVELTGQSVNIDGQTYGVIKRWNIKSPSRNPYNRDNYNDLGLNQFFMGQDSNKHYNGDPKDGIYHDDCFIVPKTLKRFNSSMLDPSRNNDLLKDIPLYIAMSGWKWVIGQIPDNENIAYEYQYVYEYDDYGTKIVQSVTRQVIGGITYAVVEKSDGTTENIKMVSVGGSYPNIEYSLEVEKITWTDGESGGTWIKGYIPINKYIEKFGEPLHVVDVDSQAVFFGRVDGKLFVFPRGISLFLAAPKYYDKSLNLQGVRQFMPLVNLKTGLLLMSKIAFIDNWDDLFELYVHEDSEWWQPIVAIVVIIVAVLITYFTAGSAAGAVFGAASSTTSAISGIAAMGTFITGIGAISGNKWLQAVGMVLSIGASFYTSYASLTMGAVSESTKAATQATLVEASKTLATSQISSMSFVKMAFGTFMDIFQLYQTINQDTPTEQLNEISDETESETGIDVSWKMYNDKTEVDDIMRIAIQHEEIMMV